jgi:branched-chain amino acid transport system permease protein
MFVQQLFDGLTAGALYGGFALSFVMMYRSSRVLNFAQGEIGLLGAFVAWQISAYGAPTWLAIAAGIIAAAVACAGMERFLIRPFNNHANHYRILIIMLGALVILNGLIAWIWGFGTKEFPVVFGSGVHNVLGIAVTNRSLGVLATTAISALVLYFVVMRTRVGLGIRATSSNPASASASGVDVGRARSYAWLISGGLAAMVAMLVASQSYLDPMTMTPMLLYGFAAAILGGMDSAGGALLAGLAIGVSENILGSFVSWIGADFKLLVALAVVVLVLMLRPQGLFGMKEVSRL